MSRSDLAAIAAGVTLGAAIAIFWARAADRSRVPVAPPREPAREPEPFAPPDLLEDEDPLPGSMMKEELERLAEVAVSHGRDDPALDVFLAFVAALDPPPDVATLKPAAKRIGELRLADALQRAGDARVGARLLFDAAHSEDDGPEPSVEHPVVTATVERPVDEERRPPGLFEALVHAIRVVLSILS